MRQYNFSITVLMILMMFGAFTVLNGCNSEGVQEEHSSYIADLYKHLCMVSNFSEEHSRSGDNDRPAIPVLNKTEFDYLASLSVEELDSVKEAYMSQLNGTQKAKYNSYILEINSKAYEFMEGDEGLEKLEEFSLRYLLTTGGEKYVETFMPEGLTKDQIDYFVQVAVFIDKISRPAMFSLFALEPTQESIDRINYQIVSERMDKGDCLLYAIARLSILGIDITAQTFLIADAGSLFLIPGWISDITSLFNVITIFNDYRVCCRFAI